MISVGFEFETVCVKNGTNVVPACEQADVVAEEAAAGVRREVEVERAAALGAPRRRTLAPPSCEKTAKASVGSVLVIRRVVAKS